jgi:hypothetical protein
LEDAWHPATGDVKVALQGLVQICAGLHKKKQGGERGSRYLLTRGVEKVRRCGAALPAGTAEPFMRAAGSAR